MIKSGGVILFRLPGGTVFLRAEEQLRTLTGAAVSLRLRTN